MKLNNRKDRKCRERKECLDQSKERMVKAFNQLRKDHMSTDEDDSSDETVWVSRPPTYRSNTLSRFLNKLDKIGEQRRKKDKKLLRKIKRTAGEPKEADVPHDTPMWAISAEWLKAHEEKNGEENTRCEENEEEEESEECISEDEEEELDFGEF